MLAPHPFFGAMVHVNKCISYAKRILNKCSQLIASSPNSFPAFTLFSVQHIERLGMGLRTKLASVTELAMPSTDINNHGTVKNGKIKVHIQDH